MRKIHRNPQVEHPYPREPIPPNLPATPHPPPRLPRESFSPYRWPGYKTTHPDDPRNTHAHHPVEQSPETPHPTSPHPDNCTHSSCGCPTPSADTFHPESFPHPG